MLPVAGVHHPGAVKFAWRDSLASVAANRYCRCSRCRDHCRIFHRIWIFRAFGEGGDDGRQVSNRPKAPEAERYRAADAGPRILCTGNDGGANLLQRPKLQRSSLRGANAHAFRVCQQQALAEQEPEEHYFLPSQAAVPSTAAMSFKHSCFDFTLAPLQAFSQERMRGSHPA